MEVLEKDSLSLILEALKKKGFTLVGPTIRDQSIVYDELESSNDLPIGFTDKQSGGNYRLEKRDDGALFGYTVGPYSWKRFLFPPAQRLWSATQSDGNYDIVPNREEAKKYAFIGIRSCELHALEIQDRVFLEGDYVDPVYANRREKIFTVAINCGQAGGTCFCTSMDTGPKATSGFDLALTEIIDGNRHYFVADVGSERGADVLDEVPHKQAGQSEASAADAATQRAVSEMGLTMETKDIKDLLYRNYEHPRWDIVSRRCLTCANCTLVCPTCFCTTVEDTTDLTGDNVERWRKWDSCFTMDFSYIHGGSIRSSSKSRYRQWMTHKLATWIDQFGSSGCVGCGRCITWCPVGINITEEVAAIRDSVQERAREKKRRTGSATKKVKI
jgi:Fe-S-cluster-containing hydrogenase component 2